MNRGVLCMLLLLSVSSAAHGDTPADVAPADAAMRRGQAALQRHDWPAAVKDFRAVTSLQPKNHEAWFLLGASLDRTGYPTKAGQAFTRSCRIAPTYGRCYVALADLYSRWEHEKLVVQVAQVGLRHVKDTLARADLAYYQGLAYEALSDATRALESYNLAIKARKRHAEARLQRGLLLAKLGRRDEAVADLSWFVKNAHGSGPDRQAAMRMWSSLLSR